LSYDTVVVGGGIVGAAIARKVQLEQPTKRVALLEKVDWIKVRHNSCIAVS
jgi:L-2-hydroxyglutarate oxidase LhgO